jgi:AbrB family looped-hinge helix DNA binding protein
VSGTYAVTVGDRGRLVLPADVRERYGIGEGTELVLVDSPEGLALLTRDQLKRRVRANLAGPSLVEDLLADRRSAAEREDA